MHIALLVLGYLPGCCLLESVCISYNFFVKIYMCFQGSVLPHLIQQCCEIFYFIPFYVYFFIWGDEYMHIRETNRERERETKSHRERKNEDVCTGCVLEVREHVGISSVYSVCHMDLRG